MAPWLPASMGTLLHSSSARSPTQACTSSATCPWVPPARLQLEPQLVGAAALNVVEVRAAAWMGAVRGCVQGSALSCRHSSCGRRWTSRYNICMSEGATLGKPRSQGTRQRALP